MEPLKWRRFEMRFVESVCLSNQRQKTTLLWMNNMLNLYPPDQTRPDQTRPGGANSQMSPFSSCFQQSRASVGHPFRDLSVKSAVFSSRRATLQVSPWTLISSKAVPLSTNLKTSRSRFKLRFCPKDVPESFFYPVSY